MRFVIATILLILSGLSIALGFILKGPFEAANYHKVTFKDDSAYSYLVIPHDTLTAYQGDITVKASGTKQIFYADGRERDIQDWIGTSNFVRLNLNPTTKLPDITPITTSGENANPEGSDMWRTAIKVKNQLEVPKVEMFDDTAVLLASNGYGRAPGNVTIQWQLANTINWPNVLIISGIALLLLALIFNFLALHRLRRLRGPKRRIPKAPKGPRLRKRVKSDVPRRGRRALRRAMVSAPASLITLSLLAGCSSPANSEAQSSLTKVNVVVTQAQIERIVREIAGTVFDADKTLDQNLLASRVSGPAFDARKVQYFLVGKSKKIARPEAITANPITLSLPMQLPEQSLGWQPRILMVITKSSNTTKAPQMLVLQQATPRENYKLWYLVNLLPTENFPDVPAVDTGTLATGVSDSFLSVKLTSLPYMYGDVLNKGAESKFYEQFDLTSDQFYASVSQSQQADLAKLKKANSVKFVHSLGNSNVFGLLSKADEQGNGGGGLVAMAINDTSVIKPKVRGAAAAVTTVDKKLLLGADGSSTGLNIVYQNMMLFYIPVAGKAEKIRLLGASSSILSVKALN